MARVGNSIVAANGGGGGITKASKFDVAIQEDALQKMILSATGDRQSAARLTGSLISLVASSQDLQNCTPASIVGAALRGEGMGLILGMGYYVVPYGGKAVFQISYKGLIAMAMAGGDVADMDCVEVREGEYTGRDRRTKRPGFDFSVYETDAEAEQHPIIGYYAYIEKRDGFFRSEYMSIGAILDHAEQYSQAFDRDKYRKLISGEMSPDEAERLKKKSPWYSATETMMKKTVIRRLLNSGYVQLRAIGSIRQELAREDETIKDAEAIASFDIVDVDPSTGEIREQTTQIPPEAEKEPEPAEKAEKAPAAKGKSAKSARNAEAVDAEYAEVPAKMPAQEAPDDVMGSFFTT